MGTEGGPVGREEFEATLEEMGPGGAWTCIRIPFDVQKAFGSRARVSVTGTIAGLEFKSSVFPMGDGTHFMMVNKGMQQGTGLKAGGTAHFALQRDTSPRTVDVPGDLSEALAGNPEAETGFERLPYSHKKEYVDWIESAKRPETRARRIEKALEMLSEGRRLKG